MIRTFVMICLLAVTSACAVNPMIDHRIACVGGKAVFIVTYGPFALTDPVVDANSLCPAIQVLPAPIK